MLCVCDGRLRQAAHMHQACDGMSHMCVVCVIRAPEPLFHSIQYTCGDGALAQNYEWNVCYYLFIQLWPNNICFVTRRKHRYYVQLSSNRHSNRGTKETAYTIHPLRRGMAVIFINQMFCLFIYSRVLFHSKLDSTTHLTYDCGWKSDESMLTI